MGQSLVLAGLGRVLGPGSILALGGVPGNSGVLDLGSIRGVHTACHGFGWRRSGLLLRHNLARSQFDRRFVTEEAGHDIDRHATQKYGAEQ